MANVQFFGSLGDIALTPSFGPCLLEASVSTHNASKNRSIVPTSSCLVKLLPLQHILYPLSSVQKAGWFEHPRYFTDEGGDEMQHPLCWSLSTYTEGVMHYLWRVYRNVQFELTLELCQRIPHRGPAPFEAGHYLFDAVAVDNRGVWRVVKPSSPFVSHHVPVTLYCDVQSHWFNRSSLVVNFGQLVPYHIQTLPTDDLHRGVPDHCGSLTDIPFGYVATPHTAWSDSSSDVSSATNTPNAGASETDEGNLEFFYFDGDGHMVLNVPRWPKAQKDVKRFLARALKDLDKGVRQVRCSVCKELYKDKVRAKGKDKANKLWGVKPSNLERHLLHHLGIKAHHCPDCKEVFTTKDQMQKHRAKHEKEAKLQTSTQTDRGHEFTDGDAVHDMYATSPPGATGLPTEEAGSYKSETDRVQIPQGQFALMEYPGNNYEFGFRLIESL